MYDVQAKSERSRLGSGRIRWRNRASQDISVLLFLFIWHTEFCCKASISLSFSSR